MMRARWAGAAMAALAMMTGAAQARTTQPKKAPARAAPPTTDDQADPDAGAASDDSPEPGKALDNAGVIELSKAGLGEPAIAAMVRTSSPHYDLSTPALVALRRAGVESGVIAAMVRMQRKADADEVRPDDPDPSVPHPPGVYLLASWLPSPRLMAMQAVDTTRTTSGSILGYAMSGGIASVSYRAILPGTHARVTAVGARPRFYFFTGSASAARAASFASVPQPEELSLVHFTVTAKGREVRIGSFNLHGASTGIRDADRLPFRVTPVGGGVVAVEPQFDLAPGEYGFVQTAAGVGMGAARVSTTSARVYEFALGAGDGAPGPGRHAPGDGKGKVVTGPARDEVVASHRRLGVTETSATVGRPQARQVARQQVELPETGTAPQTGSTGTAGPTATTPGAP